MAIMCPKWLHRIPPPVGIRGTFDKFHQHLWLEPNVLEHIAAFRQVGRYSAEAGGQLFGTVSIDEVLVIIATGPYRGDERGRFHYRSNPVAAQREITKQAKNGLLYLGEWHTHAEDNPSASEADKDTMRRLLKRSALNVNSLLMLIVGRITDLDGIYVCSVGPSTFGMWILDRNVPLQEKPIA